MNNRYYIYVAFVAIMMASCSTDDKDIDDSVKETINIGAHISESSGEVTTRAAEVGDVAFAKTGSKIYLQASGTWTGHDPVEINKTSTATVGTATGILNALTQSPQLYWDDFGTGDVANKTTGLTTGLTFYAVAIDDGTTTSTPTTVSDWKNVSWTTPTDGTAWASKDLLVSDNLQSTVNETYKYAAKATAANLVFHHAMSKITVNLYQGEGFAASELTGTALNASVTLSGLNHTGTVDVTTRTVTASTESSDISDITMYKESTQAPTNTDKKYATFTALAVPNSTTTQLKKGTNILTVVVNKNTYQVPADAVITAYNNTLTELNLQSGYNYVFNVIVSKTHVNITADVVKWSDVKGAEVTPVILESSNRDDDGVTGTATIPSKFWVWYTPYSETATTNLTNYVGNTTMVATSPIQVQYSSPNYTQHTADGTSTTQLYWPNHTQGYHMRAATYGDGSAATLPTVTTDATDGDYIPLTSGNGTTNDLLWATHEKADGTGALATKGNVVLTFKHKMTELTVNLGTTTEDDKVTLDEHTIVKILKSNTTGKVILGTGAVSTTGSVTDEDNVPVVTAGKEYHSFVVPQTFTDDMKLSVTLQETVDGKTRTSTYLIPLKDIKVSTDGGSTYNAITAFAEGTHYVYTLTIKKTGASVKANVVDWTKATGGTVVIL